MRLMLTLLAGLGLPLAAHAQDGFDAHGFNLAAFDGDVRDPLYTLRPGRMTEGDYFFGGLLEYAKAPLVLISPDGSGGTTRDIIVDDVLALNLSAGISPVNRVRIDLALPLYLNSTDTNGDPQGLDIGDMRLSAMIGLLQPAEDGGGFGLGLGSYLDVPSGNEAKFLGYENFAGGVRAAATYEFTRLTLTGDLGMEFRPTIALDNLTGPERLVMGAGVSYLLQDNVALNLEAHALPPLSAVEQAGAEGTDLPAEALLSMRGRNKRNFHWTLGGAAALSGGAGAAEWRLFAGGGFGRIGDQTPPDLDGDGILNKDDSCPNEPETVNDWNDTDGCPDALGTINVKVVARGRVWEGGAITLTSSTDEEKQATSGAEPWVLTDLMPEVVWTANVDAPPCLAGTGEATVVEGQATDLLVRLEPANEGMLHYIVTDEAGNPVPGAYVRYVSENEECVPRARQNLDDQGKGDQPVGPGTHTVRVMHNDYLPHTQDVTMVAGGEETIEVVLKTGQAKVTSEAIVILDKVYFETAKDVIKTESYGLLDQVASILEAHTEIKKVEVSGHTDSQGNDDYNMDLSDRRAKSVRTYLMNKGIDGARLDAKGYGETKPIDTNATSAGRAMNRRVEFNITEQAAEESDAQDVQPAGKGAEKKPDAAPAESGDATPAEKTVEKKGTEAAAAAATGATDKAKADADKAATEAADKAKADADKAKADAEKAATDKAADEAGKAMDKVTGGGK